MTPIDQLLSEAIETHHLQATLDQASRKITLQFKSGRFQSVSYEVDKERVRLTSVIATASRVESIGRDEIVSWCWQRNRFTDITGFCLDRRGRLVGQTEHPLASLDAAELAFYLETLAIECDRFEYVFSGKDAQ